MTLVLTFSIISVIFPIILLVVINIVSLRTLIDREKSSPFECGFDPKNTARIPFSTRFFLLAIIFIVFDIEIVLLIPISILITSINLVHEAALILIFIIILIIGLIHEWSEGSLDWSY